jgi:hypothetical protein
LSAFFVCATQAWNANAFTDSKVRTACVSGRVKAETHSNPGAESITISNSGNVQHARNANAFTKSVANADSAHAQPIDARRVAKSDGSNAGNEHANAFGESVGKPNESNARNEYGWKFRRNENGAAARHERRRHGHSCRLK